MGSSPLSSAGKFSPHPLPYKFTDTPPIIMCYKIKQINLIESGLSSGFVHMLVINASPLLPPIPAERKRPYLTKGYVMC